MSTPTRNPDFITDPMNPRIKKLWVDALRSGDYAQTTSYLMEVNSVTLEPIGYCCLGVLCDLAVKEGVIPPPSLVAGSAYYGVVGPDQSTLPVEVMNWAGLDSKNPEVLRGYDEEECTCVSYEEEDHECVPAPYYLDIAGINDNHATFEEIASIIEEQL